jgi:Protein of unknown function (DUF4035)
LNKRQLLEWAAFAKMEPFGALRDDYRTALQTYYLRAAWIEGDSGRPSDFLPQFEEVETTEADEIMAEISESARSGLLC